MMFGPALAAMTLRGTALGLLAAAALLDLGWRIVPNRWPAALLACGLALRLLAGDLPAGCIAAGAAFALGLLAWMAGACGGADAKLLGAAALVVPPAQVPDLLLATALAGGVLALLVLLLRPLMPPPARRPAGLLRRLLRAEAWRLRRGGPLPYAVAIGGGTAATLFGG